MQKSIELSLSIIMLVLVINQFLQIRSLEKQNIKSSNCLEKPIVIKEDFKTRMLYYNLCMKVSDHDYVQANACIELHKYINDL